MCLSFDCETWKGMELALFVFRSPVPNMVSGNKESTQKSFVEYIFNYYVRHYKSLSKKNVAFIFHCKIASTRICNFSICNSYDKKDQSI